MKENKEKGRLIEDLQNDLILAEELYDQGQWNEVIHITERIYRISRTLANKSLQFDALIMKAKIPISLGNLDKIPGLITQAENLLNTISEGSSNNIDRKKANLLSIKGAYLFSKGEYRESTELHKHALLIREKLGDKKNIAKSLSNIGDALGLLGDVDDCLSYYRKSLFLCEELNLKSTKAKIFIAFNAICLFSGNFERALDYINKGLEISEGINHKPMIALALNNLGGLLRQMGDLPAAMKAWERCIEITEEIKFKFMKVSALDFLIPAAIEIGDVNKARSFLKILEDIDKEEKTKITHTLYLLNKAFILKQSLRTHDRAESEDILKELVKEQDIGLEIRIMVLLNLCDLLLKELQMTGYIEILDEIQHYVDILLDITEKRHGYLFLAEIYLLQARVSLLTFNFKESKRYFTQAQQIAEQWKLTQISSKIAKEKEEFLRQIKNWEKHKKENIPLKERLELVQLDKQIELMLQNRTVLISQIVEEKVEVHKVRKICMICKGDVSRYIYVCECDAIYCENCVKALVDLENACWVCDSPIDKSKPVTHFKKDEVEIKQKITDKKKIN